MESKDFDKATLSNFVWTNKPNSFSVNDDCLFVRTDEKTDFWQETWYKFRPHSGHVFGIEIKDDFVFEACIEADFTTLYDQAGLMILSDKTHWLKAGIEYNDGQPMVGSVLTNQLSDWATGIFQGDPRKFWMRLTKVDRVVCVKYSCDNVTWNLLRLCPFPVDRGQTVTVGLMCCTPQRAGLDVKFSDIKIRKPDKDILHSN